MHQGIFHSLMVQKHKAQRAPALPTPEGNAAREQAVWRIEGALKVGPDGDTLSDQQFFSLLVPNLTVLEVHGTLSQGGTVLASRIEVEDEDDVLVEIEGDIVSLASNSMSWRVAEVEKGSRKLTPSGSRSFPG